MASAIHQDRVVLSWERLRLVGERAREALSLQALVAIVCGVLATTIIIGVIETNSTIHRRSAFYLLVVVCIALIYGRAAALLTSLLAFVAEDFFFTPPLYSIGPRDTTDWLSLLILFAVSVVITYVAASVRDRERHVLLIL